ncbi:MAG: hypothetical protein V1880_04385 [Patescibacteria group bacterium]
MNNAEKEIADASLALLQRLPESLHGEVLLTGGGAAFLYGSDRPFSHDMDFMIPADRVEELRNALGLEFTRHTKKPVFHSLKAVFEEGGRSYDLIAESVVGPAGQSAGFSIRLTDEILQKKKSVMADGQTLYLIPRELLVLIKLLAGRGEELGKYDLYDVRKILEAGQDFDFDFFIKLIGEFCRPLKDALPILTEHAKEVKCPKLEETLKSLRQYG